MPGQPLPTLPTAEIAKHNTSKSCYVTHGTKVYDVTDFLSDHPGGADLILEHIRDEGHDVEEIMQDEVSHAHTEAAYEILEEHLIGYIAKEEIVNSAVKSSEPEEILPLPSTAEGKAELRRVNGTAKGFANGSANGKVKKPLYEATGMSSAEDLNQETDHNDDFKTHHFLDLDKPLLMQVWFGGFDKEFYLQQVHRPRHYKGGASAPIFGNFLEPLSLTPWWVVPTVWLPCISYGSYLASQGLPLWQQVPYFILGSCIWTIVEYVLHRFLFHLDYYLPNNRVGITLHFLLHGVHHYLPMDKYRLVMPPALFLVLATPFWYLAHFIFRYSWHAATAVYCGGIFGYVCYDLTHYFLHHRTLPAYWRELKKYHLQHHFADFQNGFGVTSKFWDRVFGTEIVDGPPRPKVLKTT